MTVLRGSRNALSEGCRRNRRAHQRGHGTLRAGERVPSVRRLSRQQGVSVSTVLQAYQRLEDIGLIEARPQSGYYVRRRRADVEEPETSRPPRRVLTVEVNALADAMLAHANDPAFVAFGSGCPSPELFPLERVRRVISSVARRVGKRSAATVCLRVLSGCAARWRAARLSGAAASIIASSSPPRGAWRPSISACAQ